MVPHDTLQNIRALLLLPQMTVGTLTTPEEK